MNKIIITFKTMVGRIAYIQISKEGNKEDWKNKQIANRLCDEKITSYKPFIVELTMKIGWLAEAINFKDNLIQAFAKYKAKLDIDYSLEVI